MVEIDFDGITYYSNLPTKRIFEIDNDLNYIELKNIGFLFLQSIYNSLGIYDLLRKIKLNLKIEYNLNCLTKLLVFEKILDSWSKKKTFENKEYTYIKNNSNEVVFKYKSRINEITLTYKNEDGTESKKITKEKEIIYWSKKHYEKELHQNKKFIEYL